MSSTIHYFHRDHIIRELEYLRNQREKCGICDEKFCPFCEAVKELENEMWKKAFFGVQLHVTE